MLSGVLYVADYKKMAGAPGLPPPGASCLRQCVGLAEKVDVPTRHSRP